MCSNAQRSGPKHENRLLGTKENAFSERVQPARNTKCRVELRYQIHQLHQTKQANWMFVAYLFLSNQRSVTPPPPSDGAPPPSFITPTIHTTQANVIGPLDHQGWLGEVANVVGGYVGYVKHTEYRPHACETSLCRRFLVFAPVPPSRIPDRDSLLLLVTRCGSISSRLFVDYRLLCARLPL